MRVSRRSLQEARSRRERLLAKVWISHPALETKLQLPIPTWQRVKVRRCGGFRRAGAREKRDVEEPGTNAEGPHPFRAQLVPPLWAGLLALRVTRRADPTRKRSFC